MPSRKATSWNPAIQDSLSRLMRNPDLLTYPWKMFGNDSYHETDDRCLHSFARRLAIASSRFASSRCHGRSTPVIRAK